VDVAGTGLDVWPVYLFHPGALAVCVAIDRRASCRVDVGVEGVEIESKDTLQKVSGRDVSEIMAKGEQGLIAHLLRAFGVETGVRVATHLRVAAGSGLGGSSALAVATAGALAHATGRKVDPDAIWPMARDGETRATGFPAGLQDYHAALRGGALVLHLDPGVVRVERLAADPARIEESLLLADAGPTRSPGMGSWDVLKGQIEGDAQVRGALAAIAEIGARVHTALVSGRFDDVSDLVAEEWEARKRLAPDVATDQMERIAEAARAAGGAARPCGAGGGTVAIWAPPGARGPGRREAVKASLEAAGVRVAAARVDLRGLDVE
jgi:D-glycero-alpha-D-manno-heptose-7-phosphate kinase